MDKDPGPVGADFPLGVEVGHEGSRNGVVDMGIVEDDQRALSPSSRVTFLKVAAALAITILPVPTSPVSETLATPGWATRASPVRWSPWTTLKTPSGRPASV